MSRIPIFFDARHRLNEQRKAGFTLVELLIVIVVIAILAAITIVAYNGITQKARTSVLQSDLAQAAQQLAVYNATNGAYPDQATSATLLHPSTGITFSYIPNYDTTANDYCLVATSSSLSSAASYYLTSQNTIPTTGACNVTNGLVGWWKLNGDATDASGNGNNGILHGSVTPSFVMGEDGIAQHGIVFNGDGYVSFTSPTSLDFSNADLSVSAWFNLSAATSGWNDIIAGQTGSWSIGLSSLSGNQYLKMTDTNTIDAPISSQTVTTNKWYHAVVTWSASSHVVSYYLNGASDGSGVWNVATYLPFASGAHTIGARNANAADFYGALDDVRVYGRVLSSAEVQALYAAGAQ